MSGLIGEMRRGHLVVEFEDQYGDKRIIHRTKGSRLSVKRMGNTPSHAMNRAAAVLIGQRIKSLRKAANLTMDDLCRLAGLSAAPGQGKARVYALENATRQEAMRIGTLYAVALALGVNPSELMPSSEEVAQLAGVGFGFSRGLVA